MACLVGERCLGLGGAGSFGGGPGPPLGGHHGGVDGGGLRCQVLGGGVELLGGRAHALGPSGEGTEPALEVAHLAVQGLERLAEQDATFGRAGEGLGGAGLLDRPGEAHAEGGVLGDEGRLGGFEGCPFRDEHAAFGLGLDELGVEARALGLEGRDHVHVGGGIEGGAERARALAQHRSGAPGALDQALDAPERGREVLLAARGELGGRGGGVGVEPLEGLGELALLGAQDCQALGGDPAALAERRQLCARQVQPHGAQLRGQGVVVARRDRLALEGADLAADLAHEVAQALEVLLGGRQPALGALTAPPVLEHAGGLFDDGPAVLGSGVEDRVELALPDDHVLLAPDPRVAQELLDVEEPARGPVDGVLAVAGAKQRAGDGHLGHVNGELPRGVVDGEGDLGAPEGGTRSGPGEDDVFHLLGAQRARALGAEHPRDGVDHIGLAAAVRADHHGDARLELEHGRVGEGLEPLHREGLQKHRADPTNQPRRPRGTPPRPLSTCSAGLDVGRDLPVRFGSARSRRSIDRRTSPARSCCGSAGTAGPPGRRPRGCPDSRRSRRRGPGTARRPATSRGA